MDQLCQGKCVFAKASDKCFLPERVCHDSSVQQHWLSANIGGYFVLLCDGVSCKFLWPLAGYIFDVSELLVFPLPCAGIAGVSHHA